MRRLCMFIARGQCEGVFILDSSRLQSGEACRRLSGTYSDPFV